MTDAEKARELAIAYTVNVNSKNIKVYDVRCEFALAEMAAWKERQLKEVCEKHCLPHNEQERKRCVWLSIEGKHCWKIENERR